MDAPKSADKARASSDSKVLDPIVALPTASATMAQPSTAGLYDALTPEEEIGVSTVHLLSTLCPTVTPLTTRLADSAVPLGRS
jgi:hypothetical protein